MRLFVNQIPYQIESLDDLNLIDKSALNDNQIKAIHFFEKWFQDQDFIFQSSGSTGVPKQFVFNKKELIWSATQTINYLELNKKPQHFYVCLDTNLVAGAMLLARAILLKADITIVNPSSNPLENVPSNHEFTFISLVPMQLQFIVNHSDSKKILNRFENVLLGGAPATNALKQQCSDLEAAIWETYGMTETLSHIALRNIKSTAGFVLLPNNEIAICKTNTLKIKNLATKHKWLITNDLVEINQNHFYILGRIDFVINSGGKKINPIKVESEIENYFTYKNIKPFPFFIGSLPDTYLGQKVVLFIEQKNEEKITYQELKTYLQKFLQPFEIPKEIHSLPQFYYTKSQKIDRNNIQF